MSDLHAGGAAWLDAVLYDGKRSEKDHLLDAHSIRAQDIAPSTKREGVSDQPGVPLDMGRLTGEGYSISI
jgi:hypothetical protein